MILNLYIARRFLAALIKVQVIVLGLTLLFDSVDLLREFSRQNAEAATILKLALVRAPALLSESFPLVILIASLWNFLALARSSELVVIRAAGISGLKLVTWPLLTALLLGVIGFSLVNPVVAALHRREAQMRDSLDVTQQTRLSLSERNIWLRQSFGEGQMVVEAVRAEPDGSALFDVRMFQFDATSRLESRTEAEFAELGNGEWVLRDALRWQIAADINPVPEIVPVLRIPTDLTRDELLDSFASPETISFWSLPSFILRMESAGFSGTRHRMFYLTELARPLILMAMTLIGAVFAMRPARFGSTGLMVMAAVLAGFGFYFVGNIAASFGAAGQVPLLVAAWAAPLAAMMLALALLLHLEDG